MTEDEAKTKLCPQILGIMIDLDGRAARTCCFGSQCMAWRVTMVGHVYAGDEYETYRKEGYCGLAGAPA